MVKPPPLLAEEIAQFVGNLNTSEVQVVDTISQSICCGQTGLEHLISMMGSYLTSNADSERARAALLVGKNLYVHKKEDILAISNAMLDLHVPGLGQADRQLALTILLQLLQKFGRQLAELEVDMLQGTIAAIDGEKDPRCLLLSFKCGQQAITVYQNAAPQVPAAQSSLDANLEELFDVVACYFPISFRPPPNNVHGITRQDLADALQQTLTCTSLFAPLFIPMLVEKLSSTLRQAKLDALAALPAAAAGFGALAMQPHLPVIWRTLKPELLAPAAAAALPDEQKAAQQVVAKAAECLTRMTAALSMESSNPLPELVLADEQVVGDILNCLSGPKQQDLQDPNLLVQTAATIVAAVTEGSIAACQLVCSQLLPKLVQVIKEPQQTHADSSTQHGAVLALGVLVKILQAARRLVTASSYQQDPLAGFGASVLAAVTHSATDATADQAASQAKTASAAEAAVQNESLMHLANAGSETADDDDEMTGNAAKLLQLHVLTELVSFPAELTVISQQDARAAVQTCLQQLLGEQPHLEQPEAQQAITALANMAGAGYSDLPQAEALHPLLTAATEESDPSGQWEGALPLAALTALCKPNSQLRKQVLQSMQQLLPTLLAAGVGSHQHEQMLIGVLRMLTEQLHEGTHASADDDNVTSEVARHLLTGMLQLTKAGHTTSGSIATACAQAMQAATARCTPQQQWQLAELASIQLDDCCRQLHILPQPAQADGQQQPRHQTLGSPSVFPQHGGTAQQQAQQQQHHFHYQPEQQQQHEHALTALHPVDQQHQLVEQSSMMAAATVAGLWPEVLQQAGHVLECLLCLALGLRCTEAQQAAMVAAAAVLNKWPTGEAATLQGAIAQAQSLLYLSDSSAFSMEAQAKPAPASFISLAWLIKGLYMAGHAGAFDLAMLPIQYLVSSRTTATLFSQADSLHGNSAMESTAKVSDSTAQQKPADLRPTEDDSDVAETQAAAALVYQLVPAGIQDGVLSFSKDLAHTKQKPLWQQRFFTQILQQLQQRLTSTATSATVDVATNGHQQGSPDLAAQEEHLLVALAHLVNGTPAHVVKPALPGLVGLLLRALDVLQKERHSKVSLLLLAMLRALESVLHEAPGQQALQDKIPEVCSNLVQLTSFSKSAEVRVVSVQCLAAMLKMPYHLLHPQRKQVVAALALAVDDNKRNVRLEAIRCRKAWVSG